MAEAPDRSLTEKRIAEALRETIAVHGPIDLPQMGSAAKRVYGKLYGKGPQPQSTKDENG